MVLIALVIFILVYLVYKWVTGMEIEQLEKLLDSKLPVVSTCVLSTIGIIVLLVIIF